MEIFCLNEAGTLLVSGAIDDWAIVNGRGVDTVVDMDGDLDPGLPEAPNQILYVYFASHVCSLPARRLRVETLDPD